jgi:hypothetical protein
MSKFLKDVLLFTGIPLLLFLVACMSGDEGIIGAGIMAMVLVGAYFLLGIIMIIANRPHTGKVLLLSCGIILVVGLSTCGLILSGFSMH